MHVTRPCEAFENDLVLLLEGELAPDRRAVFEEHLSRCAFCADEWSALRAAHEGLLMRPLPELPSGASRRIRSVLRPQRVVPRGALAAALALAACVVLALLLILPGPRRPAPSPDVASVVGKSDASADLLFEESLAGLLAEFKSLENSSLRLALPTASLSSDGSLLASDSLSLDVLDLPLTAGALRGKSFRETVRQVRDLEADSWFLPSVSSPSPSPDVPSSRLESPPAAAWRVG